MRTRNDKKETATGTLWIKGERAKPFKVIMDKIAKEVGGVREARLYIPISGKTYALVNDGEVTEGTAKRIIDAYNRLKAKKKEDAQKRLEAMFNKLENNK